MTVHDPYDAFCRHTNVELPGAPDGPLRGLTFAVKDVFDIAGQRTGNGNPVWLETHAPRGALRLRTLIAPAPQWSARPTPTRWRTASTARTYTTARRPIRARRAGFGGSSSGSAVAVAGSLVGFALGTDCGGSVRLPASYCGIFGIRTTHGLVPVDGVVDLAASFDTVGWFAREPQTLRRVGEVLLPAAPAFVPTRLLIADDAFAFAGPEVSAALAEAVDRLKATFTHHRHIQVYTGDPAAWSGIFRVLQGTEIWRRHGAWIDAHRPNFGPGIAERFRWTRTIDPAEAERMRPQREGVAHHMADLLGGDALLCLPTAPGIAPKLATPQEKLEGPCARLRAAVDRRPRKAAAGHAATRRDGRLPAGALPDWAERTRSRCARVGGEGPFVNGCPSGFSVVSVAGH
jgi:amidase